MITDISEMIQANFDVLRPTLTQADVFFFGAGLKWDKSPFVAHEILHPGGVQSRAFRDFLFLGRGLAIGRHGFSPERWAREFSGPETLRYGQKISENDL